MGVAVGWVVWWGGRKEGSGTCMKGRREMSLCRGRIDGGGEGRRCRRSS